MVAVNGVYGGMMIMVGGRVWVDWSTHRGAIIHRGAAATEHSNSRTPQSSDVFAARRIAADGTAYTYTEFVNWYGTQAGQLWEGAAAATEHSHSRTPQSSNVIAARRIATYGTAYTYTDFVNWYGTCTG